jgi:hypothetical protein
MPYLDHSAQVVLVVVPFALLFTAAIVIATLWMPFQAWLKSMELLKAYAARGEEPPARILEAMHRSGAPLRPATRGDHLTHLAGSLVLAIGLAGVAWWLSPANAGPGMLGGWGPLSMILAALGAVFFAGSAAARLVAAFRAS